MAEQLLSSTVLDNNFPALAISKVLSWLPYSSAFLAIKPTLLVWPIVVQSNWPFSLQSSRQAA